MLHEVKSGTGTRMSFSQIPEVLDMPDLIEVQKNSYERFLREDLRDVLDDISPITDYSNKLVLEFLDYRIDREKPKYSIAESKMRDVNFAAPLRVKTRLINRETGEVKEQEVFLGDFPLMTPNGTFIINGAERVIVSQLVRSPGAYYGYAMDKLGNRLYSAQVIPNRGAWLEYETDQNCILYVKIDRQRKLPITSLLRAIGYGSNEEITALLGEDERLLNTMLKDTGRTVAEGLIEIYRRQRPGEPPTEESARNLLHGLFFDNRYDLAKVGRYKYNKKLSLKNRLVGLTADERVESPLTGEILCEAGEVLTRAKAAEIADAGVHGVYVRVGDTRARVVGNQTGSAAGYLPFAPEDAGLTEDVHLPTLANLLPELNALEDMDAKKELLRRHAGALMSRNIMKDDMIASISYLINLPYGIGRTDDIDHLGNRRIRSVGELLQNQIRVGLTRMERTVRERMGSQDVESVMPANLINIRPVTAAIKEFFGSSQLSQFMDQTNPLSELTNKRRLSALGPGGLNRERATFEVRDVHYSHYGRMCPIETPEGPNIGLINSLSTYARINRYGFIEAPYRVIDKKNHKITGEIVYLTADEEDGAIIAQATEKIDENAHFFAKERVVARKLDQIVEVKREEVDYMDVSPKQLVSVATAMIPFLENDDANRALMGSNMQRQAVPLLRPEAPIVATGMEYKAASDSGVTVIAQTDGEIVYVSADKIILRSGAGVDYSYPLVKFDRSNQGTCLNQRPVVKKGDIVQKDDVLADGAATQGGEIALGRNILIGFMNWDGYNYEDAVLISEKLVKEDVYTSIHIEEHELEARDTKLGPEEITRDIPNVGEDALSQLDEGGVIRIGAEVKSGDILVGKVTPKGETELTAEERLLRAIFGEKARDVRDTSMRVPHGEGGVVVDVKVFTRENKDELSPGVNESVRVYIAQKRKISVGDKMAGRHGNKGVISRILPEEDMPFLADGTPLQIVLNPLGVPSRMNIGQVLELHLGMACKNIDKENGGIRIATPVFDGAIEKDIEDLLLEAGCRGDGKTTLYDGRTGEPFENLVSVGYMYYLKLHHLVDDKIHARSTGPYSLVTQQPLGGKAQFGGQRFGEMEVWALEAYGAAYTLQEILTVKSDDMIGRVKTYEAIVKGENVPPAGVPESFKVLIKELQSLGLDIKVLSEAREEIVIGEDDEDDVRSTNLDVIADTVDAPRLPEEEDEFDEFDDLGDLGDAEADEEEEETDAFGDGDLFGDEDEDKEPEPEELLDVDALIKADIAETDDFE
ncbi:MAG: DNA-directed RNA polymerase subunit beta [Clostridiales bacterium]|nr:DNA-directed RNA polymerase subunit beta [Clostridiales bacterium]